VVVLPTGSGKTLVALKAIAQSAPAIVIVPTLDLLEQWKARVEEEFGIEAGVYSGEEHRLGPATIATYDTAYIRAAELGNEFRLVVFDEVHHLPSPGYATIAEMFACPDRLGLTATYEREGGEEKDLPRLLGGKIFEMNAESLEGVHLATYDLKRIKVQMLPEEEAAYRKDYDAYRQYLSDHNIILRTPRDFERLVMRSGRDKAARDAILARHRALDYRVELEGETGCAGGRAAGPQRAGGQGDHFHRAQRSCLHYFPAVPGAVHHLHDCERRAGG
jgi:superfamily II DNA or RNA helicase